MTNKEDIKYFDPQISVKEQAVAERLQFVPGTRTPLPSEIEISSLVCVTESVLLS